MMLPKQEQQWKMISKKVFMMAKKLSIPYLKKSSNKKTLYVRHRMMFQCLQSNIRN